MDANKISLKIINEAIEKKNYKITGILESGELIITLLSDTDLKILEQIKNADDKKVLLDNVIKLKGRLALEWEQVFIQEFDLLSNRCLKNNLIKRK